MSCLIGLSLTLIAIVAGMLLLAKTQKDNLGNIYKAVSYFVIIVAFLGFLGGVCCGLCRIACCMKGGNCPQMENCSMMNGGGMNCGQGMMMGGCGRMGMGCGEGMWEGCHKKMMCKKNMKCSSMDMDDDDDGDDMEDVKVEIMQKPMEKPAEPAKK